MTTCRSCQHRSVALLPPLDKGSRVEGLLYSRAGWQGLLECPKPAPSYAPFDQKAHVGSDPDRREWRFILLESMQQGSLLGHQFPTSIASQIPLAGLPTRKRFGHIPPGELVFGQVKAGFPH